MKELWQVVETIPTALCTMTILVVTVPNLGTVPEDTVADRGYRKDANLGEAAQKSTRCWCNWTNGKEIKPVRFTPAVLNTTRSRIVVSARREKSWSIEEIGNDPG